MRITRPQADEFAELDEIDLFDPRTFVDGDPHLAWKTLRAQAPIHRHELTDGRAFWSATTYPDVCRVLGEARHFTSERGALLKMLGTDDPAGGHQMAVTDPPRHGKVRRPLQQLLTAGALEQRRPAIAAAIGQLLEPLDQDGFDLGAAMTMMPMLVSGVLMGIPEEDHAELVRWGLMTVAPDDPRFQVDGSVEGTLRAAHFELFAYFAEHLRLRRRSARPQAAEHDLIDRLMTLEVDGTRLDDGDVVSNCYSILLGANVNTGHVVTAALIALAEDLDQYQRWAGTPELFRSGIREAMRWSSPVAHFLRYATEDVELSGVTIPAGDGVAAWIPSANRDEDVFERPFDFDVARRPNSEISFGYGPHRCIGSVAAQISLELVFREIFERVESFEIGEAVHLHSNFTAGITHLPITTAQR